MKTRLPVLLSLVVLAVSGLMPSSGWADSEASAYGKYRILVQKLHCPSDRSNYGEFRDYGYWGGGPWCGQTGMSGYWVWAYPNWYVWAEKGIPTAASVNGKYSNLLQTINCPSDSRSYGKFRDYGYWGGGPWCGKKGRAGYWVWVHPNWYVWGAKNRKTSGGIHPPRLYPEKTF